MCPKVQENVTGYVTAAAVWQDHRRGTDRAILVKSSVDHVISAGRVTACEVFPPMAAAAKRVVEGNGYAHAVEVVAKRSSDLVMGEHHCCCPS